MNSSKEIRESLESIDFPGAHHLIRPVKLLRILGYVGSSGAKHHYNLRLFHDTSERKAASDVFVSSYRVLLRQSLALAEKDSIVIQQDDMLKYDITVDDIKEAKEALVASWKASEHAADASEGKTEDKPLVFHAKGAYFTDSEDEGVTILLGRIAVATEVVRGSDKPTGNSGLNSKSALIRAKEVYKKQTPLNSYLPRLNLRPSNVDDILIL